MDTAPVHDASFRTAGALLVWVSMMIVGCAVDPSVKSPDSVAPVDDDKSRFTVHDSAEADADVRADFDAAMKYLKAGEYGKGTDLLNKVTQRTPGLAAPYINLAIAYEKMGNFRAAEESVKKALERNPEDPAATTEYGLIYRKTGRFAEARKSYERTLSRYPEFLPARKNLGILCDVYLRDLECALASYRAYQTAVPDDKAVSIWIADLEKRLGKQ